MNTPTEAASRPAAPAPYASIQGLRAWAMLLVFSYHFHYQLAAHWPNQLSAAFLRRGGLGTDTFLCICGCFLYRSVLARAESYRSFLCRRFLRLYPVYAFVLSLYLALQFLFGGGRATLAGPLTLLKNFLLLPSLLGEHPLLEVSWTLDYIVGFSLLLPLLARLLRGVDQPTRLSLLWIFWMTAWALSVRSGYLPPRVTLLLGGMLVWELASLPLRWQTIALLALPPLAMGWPLRMALLPLFLRLLLHGWAPLESILNVRLFQTLGDRGYSFYLAHGLPLSAVAHLLLPQLSLTQSLTLAFPLTLLAALLWTEFVHRFIELPCRSWAIRDGSRQSPIRLPVAARSMAAGVGR